MIRHVLLAGLIGLVACAPRLAPTTDQDACARQADDDPIVKELIVRGAGNPHFQMEGQDQLRAAKQDAMLACLRARGVVRQGGVERQKPL
jgi:hypothetical protein